MTSRRLRLPRVRQRERILKNNGHGGGRGTQRASTLRPLRCRRHTRSASSPRRTRKHSADSAQAQRRAGSGAQKRNKKKKKREMWLQRTSRSQNLRHCARSIAISSRSSRAASRVVTTYIHDTLVPPPAPLSSMHAVHASM